MLHFIRALVDNPASNIKAGDVIVARRFKPMANAPDITIITTRHDVEVCLPSDQMEVFYRVFVYGTLMRGYGNHRLLERARFISPAMTRREFSLYSLGAFPAAVRLVEGDPDAISIRGEVYEVDAQTLVRLDQLEGVSHGFYNRTVHQLHSWTQRLPVFMYTMSEPRGQLLDRGDWRTARIAERWFATQVPADDENESAESAQKELRW